MPLIGVPWPQSLSKSSEFLKLTHIHRFQYNFFNLKAYCLEDNLNASRF